MGSNYRSPKLQKLFASGKTVHYNKGESIRSNDTKSGPMWIVSGYVKRYMIANNGDTSVQIIYGPEDVFSLTQLYQDVLSLSIYDGPETYYYEALSDTHLYCLDASVFTEDVTKDPYLYRELFYEAGKHLKACVHSLENISLGSIYSKVAHQLLFFALNAGEQSHRGVTITIPVTQQDIADLVVTTRESVTRAMTELRKKGIIESGRTITIADIDKLRSEAYS